MIRQRKLPLLVYDGECSFCRLWIDRWKQITGDRVEYQPYQEVADQFPDIAREAFAGSVHLITPEGSVFNHAHAVFRSLSYVPGRRWMLWLYEKIPFFAPISEACYGFVAKHRNGFYRITRLLWENDPHQSHILTRWVFLRFIGLIYLIAFASLGVQILGLIGKDGILPAGSFLHAVKEHFREGLYWQFPTLAWFGATDAFLQFLCWGGAGLSLLLVFGVVPRVAAGLLWIFYLSLFIVGQAFLSFQWDILLLETGFLTIFLAPLQLLPNLSKEKPPSRAIVWLLRLLLFRLMFFSGVVKLTSGDPAWSNLAALTFHYETQPLPTPASWYVHQLPDLFQRFSCGLMFFIELVIPFLIFCPRRPRFAAAVIISAFMLLIMITGNYTFFNLLAIALCVLLLDDGILSKVIPGTKGFKVRGLGIEIQEVSSARIRAYTRRLVVSLLTTLVFLLNLFRFGDLLLGRAHLPSPLVKLAQWTSPFVIVNHYGLFSIMTAIRPEIIVEGSDDGKEWREYGFRYKPGDLSRAPMYVEPHQPRLDWQMWFAALGSYQRDPWFVNFAVRLLQGSGEVLALLEKNPFPGHPPRYVRAVLYEYHFTDFTTRRSNGLWWRREFKGMYLPPISLRN